MSLFNKIRAGELSLESFQRQLIDYEAKRIELMRNRDGFGAELFQSKMRDLDLAISFTQIFIEKFQEIKTA